MMQWRPSLRKPFKLLVKGQSLWTESRDQLMKCYAISLTNACLEPTLFAELFTPLKQCLYWKEFAEYSHKVFDICLTRSQTTDGFESIEAIIELIIDICVHSMDCLKNVDGMDGTDNLALVLHAKDDLRLEQWPIDDKLAANGMPSFRSSLYLFCNSFFRMFAPRPQVWHSMPFIIKLCQGLQTTKGWLNCLLIYDNLGSKYILYITKLFETLPN